MIYTRTRSLRGNIYLKVALLKGFNMTFSDADEKIILLQVPLLSKYGFGATSSHLTPISLNLVLFVSDFMHDLSQRGMRGMREL